MIRKVEIRLVNDEKVVLLNHIVIKSFNIISDDFAYTNAKEFAEIIKRMSNDELIKQFPECFI